MESQLYFWEVSKIWLFFYPDLTRICCVLVKHLVQTSRANLGHKGHNIYRMALALVVDVPRIAKTTWRLIIRLLLNYEA